MHASFFPRRVLMNCRSLSFYLYIYYFFELIVDHSLITYYGKSNNLQFIKSISLRVDISKPNVNYESSFLIFNLAKHMQMFFLFCIYHMLCIQLIDQTSTV